VVPAGQGHIHQLSARDRRKRTPDGVYALLCVSTVFSSRPICDHVFKNHRVRRSGRHSQNGHAEWRGWPALHVLASPERRGWPALHVLASLSIHPLLSPPESQHPKATCETTSSGTFQIWRENCDLFVRRAGSITEPGADGPLGVKLSAIWHGTFGDKWHGPGTPDRAESVRSCEMPWPTMTIPMVVPEWTLFATSRGRQILASSWIVAKPGGRGRLRKAWGPDVVTSSR
jgi:hypothetical protein